jgi:hypothetical protein
VERAKRPLVKWQNEATTDPDRIHRWFSGGWTHANLAAVIPAQRVILDVDRHHGGDDTLEALEAENGILPHTLTCVTGSGGLHLWFSTPNADRLRQDAHVLGPGVDTRCAGRGYVILPPSVHPCGGRYQWAPGTKQTAGLPAWAEVLLLPAETLDLPRQSAYPGGRSGHGLAVLEHETAAVAVAPVGERNGVLFHAAVRLGHLHREGHLPLDVVVDKLTAAALACGLPAKETHLTVRSGFKRAGL